MRLLLDTHALLWWLSDEPWLHQDARRAIAHPDNVVAVSAASGWEISIKRALGKLDVPGDLQAQVEANDFSPLPITLENGLVAGGLPRHHNDPFDRMLVAQALAGGFTLVTRDSHLARYGVEILQA